MARALIVGCGCRGRMLGRALIADGWVVRGTSRSRRGAASISDDRIEGVLADPDRAATVLEQVGDVAVVLWLLGTADGGTAAAVHGARLERLLEKLVDTPVRGFVYEAAGSVEPALLEGGAALVDAAARRWRIPAQVVRADPGRPHPWCEQMLAAVRRLVA